MILSVVCALKSELLGQQARRPGEGPLFDEKSRLHRAVRKRIRFCSKVRENVDAEEREDVCS